MDSNRSPFLHKNQEEGAPSGSRGNDQEQVGPLADNSLPHIPYPGGNRPEGQCRGGFLRTTAPGWDKLKRNARRPKRRERAR